MQSHAVAVDASGVYGFTSEVDPEHVPRPITPVPGITFNPPMPPMIHHVVRWDGRAGLARIARSATHANHVATDEQDVWWTTAQGVFHCPKAGGAVGRLSDAGYAGDIVVEGDDVFWLHPGASGAVLRASKRGGAVTTLAAGVEVPRLLRVCGDLVVFAAGRAETSALWAVSRSGGAPWVLMNGFARDLAVFADHVYFTNNQLDIVYAAHLHHGEPVTVAANQPGAWSVAVDASGIYWGNAGSLGREASTSDLMVSRHGDGPPRALVRDAQQPARILLGELHVYWCSNRGLEVAPKP
jgi:hypothetical protein